MNQTISAICSVPAAIKRDMKTLIARRKRSQRFSRMQATVQPIQPIEIFGCDSKEKIQTGNHPLLRKGGE